MTLKQNVISGMRKKNTAHITRFNIFTLCIATLLKEIQL